jgi:hypothetical protein
MCAASIAELLQFCPTRFRQQTSALRIEKALQDLQKALQKHL